MYQGNVQSPDGITLVGGGGLDRKDLVDSVAIAPVIVAADGGANACVSEGYAPAAVIGDFDSITAETRAALPEADMIEVSEQDTTDFEKCLTRIDAPFVLAVGFSAGRLDHLLTVFSVMARQVGPPVVLVSSDEIVFAAPDKITLNVSPGTRVSLFPMEPVTGTSSGLRWPIDGLSLSPVGQISTSNEALGPVHLNFDHPGCLVIMPRAALASVLKAVVG